MEDVIKKSECAKEVCNKIKKYQFASILLSVFSVFGTLLNSINCVFGTLFYLLILFISLLYYKISESEMKYLKNKYNI